MKHFTIILSLFVLCSMTFAYGHGKKRLIRENRALKAQLAQMNRLVAQMYKIKAENAQLRVKHQQAINQKQALKIEVNILKGQLGNITTKYDEACVTIERQRTLYKQVLTQRDHFKVQYDKICNIVENWKKKHQMAYNHIHLLTKQVQQTSTAKNHWKNKYQQAHRETKQFKNLYNATNAENIKLRNRIHKLQIRNKNKSKKGCKIPAKNIKQKLQFTGFHPRKQRHIVRALQSNPTLVFDNGFVDHYTGNLVMEMTLSNDIDKKALFHKIKTLLSYSNIKIKLTKAENGIMVIVPKKSKKFVLSRNS